MELQPNMYVRLNCNYELGIGKTIGEIDEDNFIKTKFKDDFECSLPTYMIKKASHNIVDLIEVGDFIDGKQVVNAIHFKDGFNRIELFGGKAIMNKTPIKSVVTKEMFSSVEYRVETN